MATNDYVGFIFFNGCGYDASVFFFLSMSSFITISGLLIAAAHYLHRDSLG